MKWENPPEIAMHSDQDTGEDRQYLKKHFKGRIPYELNEDTWDT